MKLVTAIIKPFKLEDVQESLRDLEIQGMTVTQVVGFGRQGGHSEVYRGAEYNVTLLPKLSVQVVVADEAADAVVVGHRGRSGDRQDRRRQDLDDAGRPPRPRAHPRGRRGSAGVTAAFPRSGAERAT